MINSAYLVPGAVLVLQTQMRYEVGDEGPGGNKNPSARGAYTLEKERE